MTTCPIPAESQQIILAQSAGSPHHSLLESLLRPALSRENSEWEHDAAFFSDTHAMTTDSYVVKPLFFAGGNIGSLSVIGTVNDLAMAGCRAHSLSLSLIIEEGFARADLHKIVQSVGEAADQCGVQIITGDTKIVERGSGDGVFINTAGVGKRFANHKWHPRRIELGDVILVSGDLGRHGAAIMAQRHQMALSIASDLGCLLPQVEALNAKGVQVKVCRDLTRGGLASCLNELAQVANLGITVQAEKLPFLEGVKNFCEIFGYEPETLACEGRFAVVVSQEDAQTALNILSEFDSAAAIIGSTKDEHHGRVWLHHPWGGKKTMSAGSGELLPRIC